MKSLIEFIARSLVENPDGVSVDEIDQGGGVVTYELHVSPQDMGKVIGRQGRIARAIRTVAKAAATKEGKKVSVEIR